MGFYGTSAQWSSAERDTDMDRLSVRHTLVFCLNGLIYLQNFFTVWYTHHSSFLSPKGFMEFQPGHPRNKA